jgi:hypothetical protein
MEAAIIVERAGLLQSRGLPGPLRGWFARRAAAKPAADRIALERN